MTDQYEPGTPVKVTIRDQEVLAFAFYGTAEPRLRWYVPCPPWPVKTHNPEEDFDTWFLGSQGTNPRRLAVVDPESSAQVERLRAILSRHEDTVPYEDMRKVGDPTHLTAMRDALSEFASAKPPRPTEVGVTVVDCDERFVHIGNGLFARCYPNHRAELVAWADFTIDVQILTHVAKVDR